MSYEFIEVSTSDHVTAVTINRPQVMNALHPHAVWEMEEVFNTFHNDADQWVNPDRRRREGVEKASRRRSARATT